MRFAAVLVVVMLGGCGASGLTIANRIAVVVSSATIACDWSQTHAFAMRGWQDQEEVNPLLGSKPSATAVDLYFVGALVASLIAWRVVPRRYRILVPLAITALQAPALIWTHAKAQRYHPGLCGIDEAMR